MANNAVTIIEGPVGPTGPQGIPGTADYNNDLAGSTQDHQYVVGISGSDGYGGLVTLGDGYHTLLLEGVQSTSSSSPLITIQGSSAEDYNGMLNGNVGGNLAIVAGKGGAGAGGEYSGAGGNLVLSSGAAGAYIGNPGLFGNIDFQLGGNFVAKLAGGYNGSVPAPDTATLAFGKSLISSTITIDNITGSATSFLLISGQQGTTSGGTVGISGGLSSSSGTGGAISIAGGSGTGSAGGGHAYLDGGSSISSTPGGVLIGRGSAFVAIYTGLPIADTEQILISPSGITVYPFVGNDGVVKTSSGGLYSGPVVDADVSAVAAIAVSKLAHGTAGQLLLNNNGTPSPVPTWTTMSGDATISSLGVAKVIGIDGYSIGSFSNGQVLEFNGTNWVGVNGTVTWTDDLAGSTSSNQYVAGISGNAGAGGIIPFDANTLRFGAGQSTPTINQNTLPLAGGTGANGQNLTIQAQTGQNSSGATAGNGGNISITAGNGGSGVINGNSGLVLLYSGTTGITIQPNVIGLTATQIQFSSFTTGVAHLDVAGNLSSSAIVDADVSASAAIAVSKLAPGSSGQILLNSATPTPTWATVSGDTIISSTGVMTVVGLDGYSLPSLADGYLFWNGTSFAWDNITIPTSLPPSGTAGGDLSGTYPNPHVAQLQGTIVLSGTAASGNVLTATSPTAAHWAAPAAGFTAGGDLSGTSTSQEVIGLLSNALPGLSTGYLNWTGSAWSLNTLPAAAITQLTQDVLAGPGSGSQAATVVQAQDGYILFTSTGDIEFSNTVTTPSLFQQNLTTNSGTGNSLTIQAQNETGTTSTGGELILTSGSGTSHQGDISLQLGGTELLDFSGTTIGNITFTNTTAVPNITQTAPTSVGGATGTAGKAFKITGQTGGATSDNSALAAGGVGGTMTLASGVGGAATAAAGTGGAGGALVINSGTGGAGPSGNGIPGSVTIETGGTAQITVAPSSATTGITTFGTQNTVVLSNNTLQFATAATGPLISQANGLSSGHGMGIQAQNNNGAGGVGGSITLTPGTGLSTTAAGSVIIQGTPGGSAATMLTVGAAGMEYASLSVAITTGTTTLSVAQYMYPYIILTGSLSGNVTVVFPSAKGGTWIVDATACTLNAHTITLQANSNNWGTTVGVSNLYEVTYNGTKLYGTTMSP